MTTDTIIIGAGHNGLVAACSLAKQGRKVTVLERRSVVGGACVTEELLPGFRVSTAAYSFSLFRPEIAEALDLAKHGLQLYPKEPRMFCPTLDGRHFFIWRDAARTDASVRAISPIDADALPRWNAFWDEVAVEVRPLLMIDPPTPLELEKELDRRGKKDLYRLAIAGSAADTVSEFFTSDELRGAFVGQGIIGTARSVRDEGTTFVMTYHAFGGEMVDGAGTWAYVRGGMGGVTQALLKCAQSLGVDVRTDAPVRRIETDGAKVTGVELEDGSRINATTVLSNADPKRTYLGLVDNDVLPEEFTHRIESIPTPGSVVKVNLALKELPDFASCGVPGTEPGPQHAGTIELSPSIDHLHNAFEEAKSGRVSTRPFMEVFIQSVTDDSLAPAGMHVASCFAQYAPSDLSAADWETQRDAAGDSVIDEIARYAPNIRDAIIHREVLGPPDLEARFGLTGGNIFHGEIVPEQVLGNRLGARSPIAGLYLCGSGAHPGGGVSGAPGWNAARAVLEDASSR